MPTQQGRRLDEELVASVASEQPCEPGQHRAICRLQRGAVNLASQDCRLVTQDHDLDGEVGVTATGESDQLEDAAERSVEEREGHGRMLAAPESGRQSAGRRPWMASRHRPVGDKRRSSNGSHHA